MFLSLLLSWQASAQVSSKAYDLMLASLLSHSVKEINVESLQVKSNVVILDAREEVEYRVSHIKNARYVGYTNFLTSSIKDVPKDSEIVVYCSVGYRSEKIAERLKKIGYLNVSNLYGGIFEWINQGKEVVDKQEVVTLNIHPYSSVWGIWLKKGNKVYK
jgi:rhodanese-related sulfurtransferase